MTRTGRPKSPIILTISWLLSCLYPCAQAQTPQHESVGQVVESVALINPLGDPIKVRRVDPEKHPIRIDGHLDEAIWSEPPDIDQLVVIDPDTLAPAPYKTSFRMFYTDAGLYASFDMEQPADTIVKRFTSRDDFDSNRDNVSFTLDTSGAGLYAYWMNLSLGDVQMDGTVKPERRFSREWGRRLVWGNPNHRKRMVGRIFCALVIDAHAKNGSRPARRYLSQPQSGAPQ